MEEQQFQDKVIMEILVMQVQYQELIIQRSHLLVVDTVVEIKALVEMEAPVAEAEVVIQEVLVVLVTLQIQIPFKVLMVVQDQVN